MAPEKCHTEMIREHGVWIEAGCKEPSGSRFGDYLPQKEELT